jgi:LuxR family transcriptional regulator, maltose regulon positive regulatory protein
MVALLESKLFVPAPGTGVVPRARLLDELRIGPRTRLVLVSAPAGFGKTTLVSSWVGSSDDARTAWLSLDPADDDPRTFWAYVAAAVSRARPESEPSLADWPEPGRPVSERDLTPLLNLLAGVPAGLALVLDDYHVVHNPEIHQQVGFLLDHLPPTTQVVISTRADPPLPLGRFRARGELVEVRAGDLRFTIDEATQYFAGAVEKPLSPADVDALAERTEGWAAALQLAALSMRGREDPAAFIARFAGDDRYVVDYLAEEVLAGQPSGVRRFLLETSILDRLTASLCDTVTDRNDGKAMLEHLERSNLFLVALDDHREWYRYHHLFADVLRAHLLDETPDVVGELHRGASTWYAGKGDPERAIRHALDGGDVEGAADLVEEQIPEVRRGRRESVLLAWLGQLPDPVVRSRPALAVIQVGALLQTGELAGAEDRLDEIEHELAARGSAGVPDWVPGSVELFRAAVAQARGDSSETMTHARRAVELATADDHLTRAAGASFLGITAWSRGDLEVAHASWAEGAAGLLRAGHVPDVLGVTIALGDIRIAQGRLSAARLGYEQALELAERSGPRAVRGSADMHVGLGEIHLEYGDLESARAHLETATELGEELGLPQYPYRSRVARGRLRQAEGDMGEAQNLLDEAEQLYVPDYFPPWRPVAAVRARLWLAEGKVDDVLAWASRSGLDVTDEPAYLREYEHLTLARALLAARPTGGSAAEAAGLLGRLLTAAEADGRTRALIEVLLLQALAAQAAGDGTTSLARLGRALELAEPEGFIRLFLDEGGPAVSLLQSAAKRGIHTTYVRRLLASGAPVPAGQPLVDPLSDRELEVLRLLGTELDGPEIARRLVVSLNTVRTHTKNIYAKLGVNSRRAAVRRAQELGLLTQSH